VAHSGPSARGRFLQTLVLTDIATGWTECAPLLVREHSVLIGALGEVRKLLPFALLGFDTDNDSVFMNEAVRDYCQEAGIDDQAWVEQKNGAVVRRIVGYRRLEGLEAAAELARLYATVRLFVNFFQPSFKLAGKQREGVRVRKRYHPPATPAQRLLADPRTSEGVRLRITALQATLDPVRLLSEMRSAQQRLVAIADKVVPPGPEANPGPTLEEFLSGLRTAWQGGEVRPTAQPKPVAKRTRRRPQGRRMKSASQKREHVLIIPGGLLATRPHADPVCSVAPHEIDGDLAEDGQVASRRPVPDAAVILAERDIQDPMQAVFYGPVSADRLNQH
jgi:hypothetical protein